MTAPKTGSNRNSQRKATYAALANKGSRNQEMLAEPIVGGVEIPSHDGTSVLPPRRRERVDARRVRRQTSAWARCAAVRAGGGRHRVENNNCRSCGCPVDVVRSSEEVR